MKQMKSILAIALFTALSLTTANAAKTEDSISTLPVELTFMGNVQNQPLFQLTFSGSEEDNEFTISVTDEEGFVFYTGNVKGQNFTKQFLLNNDDLGDTNIRFTVKGKKSGRVAVYQVNRTTKVQQQIGIEKQ